MADALDRFYGNWHDQLVPSRGGIKGQCVSLVQKYLEEQFDAPGTPVFPVANANEMFGTRTDIGTWLANTPDGVPPRGSIVTFAWNHTGVVVDADKNSVRLFQENDPNGSGAHVATYGYNGLQGWFIPNGLNNNKQGDNGVGVPNAQYDAVVVDNYNKGVEINNLKNAITELNKQIDGLNKQITDLKKQLDAKPISTDTKWETFKSLIRELIK